MEEEKRMFDELSRKLEELVAKKGELESSKVKLEESLSENIKKQAEMRDTLAKLLEEEKGFAAKKTTIETELKELSEKIARLTKVKEELGLLWKIE